MERPRQRNVGQAIFVTDRQLLNDLAAWEMRLPHFDAFAGIPRGGAWPAAWLAMRRNVPLLNLQQVRYNEYNPQLRTVLFVDDHIIDRVGRTLDRVIDYIKPTRLQYSFGTVYRGQEINMHQPFPSGEKPGPRVPYAGMVLPAGPIFEFDWHRRYYLKHAGVSLEGVICSGQFIPTAESLLFRDRGAHVKAIVTNCPESDKAAVDEWLAAREIRYDKLIMRPSVGDECSHKIELLAGSDVWFFVEGCPRQAEKLGKMSGRTVLCFSTGRGYNCRDVQFS